MTIKDGKLLKIVCEIAQFLEQIPGDTPEPAISINEHSAGLEWHGISVEFEGDGVYGYCFRLAGERFKAGAFDGRLGEEIPPDLALKLAELSKRELFELNKKSPCGAGANPLGRSNV